MWKKKPPKWPIRFPCRARDQRIDTHLGKPAPWGPFNRATNYSLEAIKNSVVKWSGKIPMINERTNWKHFCTFQQDLTQCGKFSKFNFEYFMARRKFKEN